MNVGKAMNGLIHGDAIEVGTSIEIFEEGLEADAIAGTRKPAVSGEELLHNRFFISFLMVRLSALPYYA